ncbi:hypothetical protein OEB99_17915 [Actinotalea sp. M2MS4P-6]|uniref:hypothetical protein n=1 Tax=Actinotalea sp. M2MS4P-6 TaxID=2983762 RepID=UPI0021E37EF3|nr:hypothetical protein [Actinotalea sp. M2MS4P-6]MCV2396191.1 hypothetical protein [Actinotalea sp. M2MS4P-6]
MGRHAAPGPPDDGAPGPDAPGAAHHEDHTPGPLASLVLALVVGLVTAGVLWWTSTAPLTAGLAGLGAAALVVLATWVARTSAARHPVQ